MTNLLRRSIFGLAILVGILVFVYVFLGVFIREFAPTSGVIYDGLGRPLSETPAFIRAFGIGETWVGLKYFTLDLVMFWGGIALIFRLIKFADRPSVAANTDKFD